MKVRHLPWAIALVCAVLGFMLTMQFKVQQQVHRDNTEMLRADQLAQQLAQTEQERDKLVAERDDLLSQLRTLASSQTATRQLAEQLELAQLHAGLIPVTGPGVVVTMDDSDQPRSPGENPNLYIIHDEDVLRVVNELAAAGAEAISINEQRLTGHSEIRCAGPVVTINGVRTATPLVIKAIGHPERLAQALTMAGGVVELLKPYGIQVSIKQEQNLIVPAYKGALKTEYASPLKEVPKS
jgi:uncharacterized protein YlxW (UPF0749 family)